MSSNAPGPRSTALGRPLPRGDKSVTISTFGFLFAELVSYLQSRVTSMSDLETRLEVMGAGVGVRFLELSAFRDKPGRRETSVVGVLQFISGPFWLSLFGKQADALEKSSEVANQYMIREEEPITNHFISMPKEYARVNVAAYMAGIIRGAMESASFVSIESAASAEKSTMRGVERGFHRVVLKTWLYALHNKHDSCSARETWAFRATGHCAFASSSAFAFAFAPLVTAARRSAALPSTRFALGCTGSPPPPPPPSPAQSPQSQLRYLMHREIELYFLCVYLMKPPHERQLRKTYNINTT